MKQSLKFRKGVIPLIVLVIFSLCAISSPVSAVDIPQYCNNLPAGTQIYVLPYPSGHGYPYSGSVHLPPGFSVDIPDDSNGIYLQPITSTDVPEPLTNDNFGVLKDTLQKMLSQSRMSDGNIMLLQVDYPDGVTIFYEIQPGFSAIMELTRIPTPKSTDDPPSQSPVDESAQLQGIPVQKQYTIIPVTSQSQSLNWFSSVPGGLQRNAVNFGKIQNRTEISYLQSVKYQGLPFKTIEKEKS